MQARFLLLWQFLLFSKEAHEAALLSLLPFQIFLLFKRFQVFLDPYYQLCFVNSYYQIDPIDIFLVSQYLLNVLIFGSKKLGEKSSEIFPRPLISLYDGPYEVIDRSPVLHVECHCLHDEIPPLFNKLPALQCVCLILYSLYGPVDVTFIDLGLLFLLLGIGAQGCQHLPHLLDLYLLNIKITFIQLYY